MKACKTSRSGWGPGNQQREAARSGNGQAWAKVPRTLLADEYLRDHPLHLRVLIALLCYADPSQPMRPVWPSLRRIAAEVGLKDCESCIQNVRTAIRNLAARGYLQRLSQPRKKWLISLYPVLTLKAPNHTPTECDNLPPREVRNPDEMARSKKGSSNLLSGEAQLGEKPPAAEEARPPATDGSNHLTIEHTEMRRSDQPAGSIHLHERPGGNAEESGRAAALTPSADEQLRESLRLGEFARAPEGTDRRRWEDQRRKYQLELAGHERMIAATHGEKHAPEPTTAEQVVR